MDVAGSRSPRQHCPSVNLRANPAAVVEPNPSPVPAAARPHRRAGDPIDQKVLPASVADAKPTTNSPPVYPRSRTLIDPIAAFNNLIMLGVADCNEWRTDPMKEYGYWWQR